MVVKSNGNDIKLLGDDGGLIYVNTLNQDEPIVKGNTLLDLLTELINLINQQVFSPIQILDQITEPILNRYEIG